MQPFDFQEVLNVIFHWQSYTELIETLHQLYIISHYALHFRVAFYGKKDCRSLIFVIPRTLTIISRYFLTSTGFDLRRNILMLKSKHEEVNKNVFSIF